jgi:hypothetical protein
MTRRRALLFCLGFAPLLAGCKSERERTEEVLATADTAQLRKDAALLYKELFAGAGAGFTTIPESRWPRSFRKFQPLRVGAYRDGFTLVKETRAQSEAGLYIIPLHMEHAPAPSPRAKYQPLREGIYWYAFGE